MCLLCRFPVAQNHNFWQILTFVGALLLYRPPFTNEGQIWCAIAYPWHTFTCELSSRSVYSASCSGEKSQFLPFFGLWHLVVSPVGSSLRKLNTNAQPQTFYYPTVSKSFLYSNTFMAKSAAQSLKFKNVTNKPTDKQTKNLNVFVCPGGG